MNSSNYNRQSNRPHYFKQRSTNSSETNAQPQQDYHHQQQHQKQPQKNNKKRTNQRPNSSQSSHQQHQLKTKQTEPQQKPQQHIRSEILIDQLMKFQLECMVCCHKIKDDKSVWSCLTCFHIFHLYCIKKWANSPAAKINADETAWRCPGCQTINEKVPNKYTCFCGKKTNPDLNKNNENKPYHLRQLPHTCGQICGKPLAKPNDSLDSSLICKHTCALFCHPGPCQPCDAFVTRTCNCGQAKFQVKCSSLRVPECTTPCSRTLNCFKHKCEQICHADECKPCSIEIEQECFSHGEKRTVLCSASTHENQSYSCAKPCDKQLKCGKHKCEQVCHEGECKPCPLLPSKLLHCPCGNTPIRELLLKNKLIRTQCTDPVPTCDKTCNKLLHADNDNNLHFCVAKCHLEKCPPCKKQINVKCRCGKETDLIECSLNQGEKLCNRRCHKKKLCGRHQCNEICCDDKDHFCTIICNRQLDCGKHKCEELCHKGPCPRCLVASFEERICECGQTVQYPPIRCGTKPLECTHVCTRQHDCLHPVNHSCHWEEKCPPCSYLTSKMCMGNHELRHNIPCHMKDVSCGCQCGKQLVTCEHKCIKTCHKGICMSDREKCTQQCLKQRPHCEHQCGEPCHTDNPCPDTICQAVIQAKCKCGLKTKQIKCNQRMYDSSAVIFENLASELKEMLSCKSIDISSFRNSDLMKKKHELDCDEECIIAERNKSLAQALQINFNAEKPKQVIYSEFLKNFAREDPSFAIDIEKRFEQIVKEMKLSFKVSKKMFSLPDMKSHERRFVHELGAFYGFETASQDPEPFRNVCIFAFRDKCNVPSSTLMQEIRGKQMSSMPRISSLKQMNQASAALNPVQSNLKVLYPSEPEMISVSSSFAGLSDEMGEAESGAKMISKKSEKVIDYFDITD